MMGPLKRFARWILRKEINALNDDVGQLVADVLTDRQWRGISWTYDRARQECRVVSQVDGMRNGSAGGIDHLYGINLARLLMTGEVSPSDDLLGVMPRGVASESDWRAKPRDGGNMDFGRAHPDWTEEEQSRWTTADPAPPPTSSGS